MVTTAQTAVNAHQQLVLSYQAASSLQGELVSASIHPHTDSNNNHINSLRILH